MCARFFRQEGARLLCYIIRVIVAAPDADAGLMPAPTGGGTHPVNPLPAKRIPADIRSLCRSYTDEAVRSLAAIMRNGDKDATRVAAAAILLDRGWGRPPQSHADEDGKDIIHVVIRDVAEERRQALASTYRTTPVSDEPLAASQARWLRPPDRPS